MVNAEQLQKLHIGAEWVDALNETFSRFNIATKNQQAMFIGQCGHECGNFRILEENLNYKAATLMRLWPRRFPTLEKANEYSGNAKKLQILSIAYAWAIVTKLLVMAIGLGVVVVFNLLVTRIISMLAKHWGWILLWSLTLLLLLSSPPLQLDGFGLPTTAMLQRMPLTTLNVPR